jgi:HptB-dependent secretion and biofilm anti anti-sigma factor
MAVTAQVSHDRKECTLSVDGRFDFSLHQEFRNSYEQVSETGMNYVVDLGRAEYLDSSALGMLLLLREYAGGDNAKIKIAHCRPDIKKILSIANFHRLFTID